MDQESYKSRISLALYSLILMLISLLLFSVMLYKASLRPPSFDPLPQIYSITPVVAQKLGGNPVHVQVGLHIKDFTEFDMVTDNFIFSGILWFTFDPAVISLDTLKRFSFEKGEIEKISEPDIRIIERDKLLVIYSIRVKFKTNINYVNFPFNSHTIYIVFDNNFVSPSEVIFDSNLNDFSIDKNLSITGWKEIATKVYSGYSQSQLHNKQGTAIYHPRLIFSVEYTPKGMRQALTILLPLIFIFFMAVFSLAIDTRGNYSTVLVLSSGAVTALLAYRFVIENLSPKVGYFMLSDYLFFLFLTMSFIIFFINLGRLVIHIRGKKLLALTLHIIVLLACFYLMRN